jgi:hypothetical protein
VPEDTKKLIPKYIDTILSENTAKEQQDVFDLAFERFNVLAMESISKTFLSRSEDEKMTFLKNEEVHFIESGTPTYFDTVKQLVYQVFFNTEV